MNPVVVGVLGIVVMLVFLFCAVPVGYAMAIVGSVGIFYLSTLSGSTHIVSVITTALATTPYSLIANATFAVLPLFLLMANICFESGLGSLLFLLVQKWMGRLPGGLAIASVWACTIFGAISASSIATSLTIGLVALPEMRKNQYHMGLAAATIASGGVIGILIPPSGIMIVYGIMTGQSIGQLFIAGLIPGIMMSILFMAVILFIVLKNPKLAPPGPPSSFKEKIVAFGGAVEIILLIILVIGGLLAGWFTPTEAGGIGAFGAIILSLARRRLSFKSFKKALIDTVSGSGMIYVILIGAFIFNLFIGMSTLPQEMTNIVKNLALPPMAIMAVILLIYIILGCFIDSMPMILLTVPTFYPVVVSLGFDPILFGVVIVIVTGIGMITPPVGMSAFVVQGLIKDISLGTVFKWITPFLLCEIILIILILAFPEISLFPIKFM
jgi:C4-dicarboxylate transporter, DctM subunit